MIMGWTHCLSRRYSTWNSLQIGLIGIVFVKTSYPRNFPMANANQSATTHFMIDCWRIARSALSFTSSSSNESISKDPLVLSLVLDCSWFCSATALSSILWWRVQRASRESPSQEPRNIISSPITVEQDTIGALPHLDNCLGTHKLIANEPRPIEFLLPWMRMWCSIPCSRGQTMGSAHPARTQKPNVIYSRNKNRPGYSQPSFHLISSGQTQADRT